MALPGVISYCKITGLFLEATADTSGDPDDLPQGNPLVGATVTFRAAPSAIRTSSPAATTIPREFVCQTDASGYLYSPGVTLGEDGNAPTDKRFLYIMASDDPDIEPHDWSWYFKVYRDDLPSISGSFIATADGEIDLATVVQVPASPGAETAAWIQAVTEAQAARDAAITAQGLAEAARDAASGSATAAAGSATAADTARGLAVTAKAAAEAARDASNVFPATAGLSWTGAVNLADTMDHLYRATLTGNVTLGLLTPSAASAFMLTLVLVQDATGSRTLTVTGAKWAYGVPAVLSTAAGAIDVLHLLWTGTAWVGLVGAQAVA